MGWLADVILVVHCAFVLFVTGGLLCIWIGAAARWRWVRNFRFRIAHLVAICGVALEALLGITCPLTEWEDALRGVPATTGFVAKWLHRLLYYSFPEWAFTAAYASCAVLVAATWLWVRPARR